MDNQQTNHVVKELMYMLSKYGHTVQDIIYIGTDDKRGTFDDLHTLFKDAPRAIPYDVIEDEPDDMGKWIKLKPIYVFVSDNEWFEIEFNTDSDDFVWYFRVEHKTKPKVEYNASLSTNFIEKVFQ